MSRAGPEFLERAREWSLCPVLHVLLSLSLDSGTVVEVGKASPVGGGWGVGSVPAGPGILSLHQHWLVLTGIRFLLAPKSIKEECNALKMNLLFRLIS